jgi:hypothetical protein
MLYNILNNKSLKLTLAIPADEGLADIAFVNGWRILVPAQPETRIAKSIMRREAWEWGIYLYDLSNSDEIMLMADDSRFSPFVEDCDDEVDEDEAMLELDDPAEDADSVVELGSVEHSFDYVETFHHLNQQ